MLGNARLQLDRTLGMTLNETSNITIGSLADVGVVFAPTEINGDKLVLRYPGVPSRCPRCPTVYRSTGCHVMQSMFRHLEVSHGLRGLKRWWKCSLCEFSADGHKLNAHFKKNHPGVAQQPPEAPHQHETISQNQSSASSPRFQQQVTMTPPHPNNPLGAIIQLIKTSNKLLLQPIT